MHLLIDGRHFAYRAFYATPELTRSTDGFPIGAIHGWCRILWSLIDNYSSASMEIFWDAGSHARLQLDASYKANRKPTPSALAQQLPHMEALSVLLGLTSYKEDGSEADDLIASRAWSLADASQEVLIVSADKDFAQCVGPRIHLLTPPPTASAKEGWRQLDAAAVKEKFGVEPTQIADYLALMGDTSDNVKGLEGVGPKTAAEWLRAYRHLEGILDNCGRLNPKRFQNIVYESRDLLLKNRAMTTLHRRELPAHLATPGRLDPAALVHYFQDLHLKTCAQEAQKRYTTSV